MSVGIVVVSHSRRLAEAAVGLALDMVQGIEPPLAIAAGGPDDGLGTDAANVADAIRRVASPDGVLVIMDLGSAVLSAELALELLPDLDGPVKLCSGPFVEGLVAAVVRSAGGARLDEVSEEAESALAGKRAHLGADTDTSTQRPAGSAAGGADEVAGEVDLVNDVGLHARPAALLVRMASSFDADLSVANVTTGKGPVSGSSLIGILSLGAQRGDRLRIAASGPQAAEAVEAVRAAAAGGFGE